MKESNGWYLVWSCPTLSFPIERVALNAKLQLTASGGALQPPSHSPPLNALGFGALGAGQVAGLGAPIVNPVAAAGAGGGGGGAGGPAANLGAWAAAGPNSKLVAVASGHLVRLWWVSEQTGHGEPSAREIGTFSVNAPAAPVSALVLAAQQQQQQPPHLQQHPPPPIVHSHIVKGPGGACAAGVGKVDELFFIGAQLVALDSARGRIGVWHGATGNWQVQDVGHSITSFDTAGLEFLLLGSANGAIYYIGLRPLYTTYLYS